jgi:hypothetical protein
MAANRLCYTSVGSLSQASDLAMRGMNNAKSTPFALAADLVPALPVQL